MVAPPLLASRYRSIQEWFEVQAARQPHAVAVCCGEEELTYGRLNQEANRIARQLQQLGVGPESLVALYLERGCRMVASILAVLKAGGAYVPIDLAYPKERVRFMLEDARPLVLVSEEKLTSALPSTTSNLLNLDDVPLPTAPTENLPTNVGPDSAAYVIYTSGSTGTPKGVVVTHQNVLRLFQSTEQWFQFSSDDVWTLFHSFAFDFSVWELWGALLYGGRLVIVPYASSRSPEAFHQLLVREGVTVLNQTPSAFRQLIWADQTLADSSQLRLRWVIFGGEALELQSLKPWFDRHGDRQPRLVNMYGITETTVHVTYRPIQWEDLQQQRGSVIGIPIPDLSVHILDEELRPCPVDQVGEIYVGGAGVARGYLGRPKLTAQRFIADPFDAAPGARLYRSGDLAKRLPEGDIEYLGRADQQVKIRGFRIELGEIEAVLNAHPAVRESVVTARAEANGGKQLTAYLVCQPQKPVLEELRQCLGQKLPAYMVPSQFVFLERLPLTPHGKVDRRALPAPGKVRPELANPLMVPTSAAERVLASIWEGVLQIDEVGVHDNFFALGGDSIRSIQVLAQARERGLKLSLDALFAQPTIFELARSASPDDSEDAGHLDPFALLAPEDRARLPHGLEDAYPMAKLQIGMVYHSSRDLESAIFHDVFSFRFHMPWDQNHLRTAIQHLAQRHAIFRTSFDPGTYSEPLQLVHPRVTVPFTVEDLRSEPAAQKDTLVQWVEQEKRNPFDWTQPPFLRLHVQRLSEETFQFIVSFHHVIMDGWSLAAMLTELFQEYAALLAGRALEILPPPIAYRDFVLLETRANASEAVREFWRAKLAGAPFHSLPRWPETFRRGGKEQQRGPELLLEPAVVRGLQQLANAVGVPLRAVLLAAHCRVMSVLTGQWDIVTGLVSNGRPQVTGGERLIGLFLNTVPFRIPVSGGTWRELVAETFSAERALLAKRRCALSEIQQLAGGQPLFETVFDFVQFHVYRDLPGYQEESFLEDHYFEANNFTFYQTFMLDASGTELRMHCDYDPNELCEPQVAAIGEYYSRALTAMAFAPQAPYQTHSLLPDTERHRLLVEWNRTQRSWPYEAPVHVQIERQASQTPAAVAVSFAGQSLTYAELNERASRCATRLQAMGLAPGSLVGVHLGRSLEMLIALLAVLKAGGAYVPLDPSYPEARLEFMVADAGLKMILTSAAVAPLKPRDGCRVIQFEALLSPENPGTQPTPVEIRPEHLAYVIYTSGSTGQPKGVQIPHGALANFLCSMQDEPGLSATDTLLAVTTLSFDIAALELFLPLTVGARVVMASREDALDPAALAELLAQNGVTALQATPTTWGMLVRSNWAGDRNLKALCGGEAMPRELAHALLDRCGEVWNMYGPTETTVWSCLEKVQRNDGPVPIGRPIANTDIYILDAQLQPVPIGSEGEMYIGGKGLASGYLGRPDLTGAKFIAHPFEATSGARLYRTGDLGRYLPDGRITCSGRTDHQVKVRGFRIELEEVESTLARHPAVAAAVVAAKDDEAQGKQLVGYYLRRPDSPTTDEALRAFLAATLPPHMVPSIFMELEAFPLTPNGKVDRRQLPEPASGRTPGAGQFVAPRTPLEERLVVLWRELLKIERVGIQDNFFALGGHSLLAIQLIGRLRQELQVELSVAALFQNPTIESLAWHLLDKLLQADALAGAQSKTPENPLLTHAPTC